MKSPELIPSNAATISGKYRVSGFPDLAINCTLLRVRNTKQRKPSHFGSNCHAPSDGSVSTNLASIGRMRSGDTSLVRRLILGVRLGGIFRGMELERRIVPKVPVATQGDEVGFIP